MPSDPLPLSPETHAGKAILDDFMTGDGLLNRLPPRGLVVEQVIAIEQEARTLARTQTLQEAAEAVAALDDGSIDGLHESEVIERVLAALSRLGERE